MDERVQKYDSKMTKTLNGFEAELSTIRAGRAKIISLDKICIGVRPHTITAGGQCCCA